MSDDERVAQAIEARAAAVYPADIFRAPTSEQYAEINALLKRERGHQLDGIAADVMRRAHAGIARELREGTLMDYHAPSTAPLTPEQPPADHGDGNGTGGGEGGRGSVSGIEQGAGDDLDVAAGRCCPHCRHMLTEHNVAVWNAGYSVASRHAKGDIADAWEAGWHEHYLEWEAQEKDPRHPITKRNPHREGA